MEQRRIWNQLDFRFDHINQVLIASFGKIRNYFKVISTGHSVAAEGQLWEYSQLLIDVNNVDVCS